MSDTGQPIIVGNRTLTVHDRELLIQERPGAVKRIFALFPLAVSIFGTIAVYRDAFTARTLGDRLPFLVVSIPWIGFCILAAVLAGWYIAGMRTIAVSKATLIVASKIGPFTIGRRKQVTLQDSNSIQVESDDYEFRGNRVKRYKIICRCLGSTTTLVRFLEQDQASLISSKLRDRINAS